MLKLTSFLTSQYRGVANLFRCCIRGMLVFFKCYCSLEPKLCVNLIISQLFLVEKLSVYNNVYQLPTNENGDVRRGLETEGGGAGGQGGETQTNKEKRQRDRDSRRHRERQTEQVWNLSRGSPS